MAKKSHTQEKPKASTASKKPELFVKALRGSQYVDPISGDIYRNGELTPVKKVTEWVRFQADTYNLFEIIE